MSDVNRTPYDIFPVCIAPAMGRTYSSIAMAVSVEIKTGTRRLIEFFLSPLLRGLHETARER